MRQKLMTLGTFGKLFCGVEHTSKNGANVINGLLLKQQKNEFSIAAEFKVNVISDLKNHLTEAQHLFVTINTAEVLFKALDGKHDDQVAISMAFPNLKIDEFFFELHTSNAKTYIAICRKDVIENILEKYTTNQFNVIGFSLGNLGVFRLENFINSSSIQTSNSTVQFTNKAVSGIAIADVELDTYSINGLIVNNSTILSLAGILAYYINQSVTSTNYEGTTNQLKSNFKHKRIFSLGLKFGLGVVFIALLVSFILFTHYSSKIEEATSSLNVSKSQKTTLLKLSNDVAKKEKLLNDFSLTSSNSSWHLDQLGQIMPNSVLLTEIQWQPLDKTIKENIQIKTQERTILIKGTANNAFDFSKWMDQLEKQKWIKNVSINAYGNGKKKVPAFEIELTFTK